MNIDIENIEALVSLTFLFIGFGIWFYRRWKRITADDKITLDEAIDLIEDAAEKVADLNDDIAPFIKEIKD
jgi:hypothetical protein